jgi:hypothetical protein
MRQELLDLKARGIDRILLNGWYESVSYVLSLTNVSKVDDNSYVTA